MGGSTALFHQILANEGFAIFSVDNRGTPIAAENLWLRPVGSLSASN